MADISQMSDAQLQQAILAVSKGINTGNEGSPGFVQDQATFFANVNNMPFVRQAIGLYGFPSVPGANQGQAFYMFYWACQYYSQFQFNPAATVNDCTTLSGVIAGLQAQIVNVQQLSLPGSILAAGNLGQMREEVLNDILSQATGLYSSLSCATAVVQQQQQQQVATIAAAGQQAAATTAGSSIGTYILYGCIGLAAILIIRAVLKHKKPAA